MTTSLRPQDFPVGPKPDWELDAKLGQLNSILESCVLATSLQESRTAWLNRLLPKFSSRGRGNKPAADSPIPAPHTIDLLSKCTLEVGPHTMPDLLIYAATYIDLPSEAHTAQSTPAPPTVQPHGGLASSSSSIAPTDFFDEITKNGLVKSINLAAQRDPRLAHCVREAIAGRASPEEVRYITTTINQLTATDSSLWQPAQPALVPTSEPSSTCDIIFEFKERPNDRWLLPRGPAFIEREPPDGARLDMIQVSLLLYAPAPTTDTASGEPSSSNGSHQAEVATLRLKQPAQMLYESLIDWVGGIQQNSENRDVLRKMLKKARTQQFLQYRLPMNSDLLGRFKTAAESPFPMKSIKPDPSATGKRKRSLASPKKTLPATPLPPKQSEPTTSTIPKPLPKKRRTKSTPSTSAFTTKRRSKKEVYVTPQMPPPPPPPASPSGYERSRKRPIACHHCGATGEPLLLGGRFCRPCIEAGHGTPIPGVTHAPVPAAPVVRGPVAANMPAGFTGQAGSSSTIHPPRQSTSRTVHQ